MGIDLAKAGTVKAREDEGQVVHIRDETGDLAFEGETPVTVKIQGSYSAAYRRVEDEQLRRQIKRRLATVTPDQLTANRVELVAACILDWSGFTDGGRPFPCTRENATRLLEVAPWVLNQLAEAQQDHASFFGSRSAS
jgi:hypothetical protein